MPAISKKFNQINQTVAFKSSLHSSQIDDFEQNSENNLEYMSIHEKDPLLAPKDTCDNGTNDQKVSCSYMSTTANHRSNHHHLSRDSGLAEQFEVSHSIGNFGSFALIMNNLTGPAMLGLPCLFQTAGILPVVLVILFVYLSSSLCGALLADTIASLPGNKHFTRKVDFSSAFRLTVGASWYTFAESLFLLSCAVQAIAGIVESAQSLDGFIASFLLGKTYGLQVLPELKIVSWSTTACHGETMFQEESGMDECTPFHDAGSLICTLGFFMTTVMFLPLGRGHIQETMAVQYLSFGFMIVLLGLFMYEFTARGLDNPLPVVGPDLKQLAGVVLFNYAFSVTIPAWLSEKKPTVSVNRTIWTASTCATIIYIIFGILGAMAFSDPGQNILVVLTSSKAHNFTRLCAALFGVTIIGCGVPVYCVIIKNALEFNRVCSPSWALIYGSIGPYALSWMLYQGTFLMGLLNWTGLFVNGIVAFLLPMILALKSTELRIQNQNRSKSVMHSLDINFEITQEQLQNSSLAPEHDSLIELVESNLTATNSLIASTAKANKGDERSPNVKQNRSETSPLVIRARSTSDADDDTSNSGFEGDSDEFSDDDYGERDVENASSSSIFSKFIQKLCCNSPLLESRIAATRVISSSTVQPLPTHLELYRREIVLVMIMSFVTLILITVMEDAISGIIPTLEK